MKRLNVLPGITLSALISVLLLQAVLAGSGSPSAALSTPSVVPADLFAGHERGQALVNVTNLALMGPDACTAAGDAVSPGPLWNPNWIEQEGVFRFRLDIPPDYPHDVVRVELFDPDSINQITNTHTISYTQRRINAGYPATALLSCDSEEQQDTCLIPTCELEGQCAGAPSTVPLDLSNPFWLVRVDENRGSETPGQCGLPEVYDPSLNTETRFELFHFEDENRSALRTPLASYTGQAGDGVRDDGDHQTDMRWVAPGGQGAFDQPAAVPSDCGSPTGGDYHPVHCPLGTAPGPGRGFEISLSEHLGNTVVDESGNRSLYLDVTAVSGASKNGYAVWAGPPTYLDELPGEVNGRNVQLVNEPLAYHSQGITVKAVGLLALNSNYPGEPANTFIDVPLTHLGPEYSGQVVTVTLFDVDDGSHPPILFYLDSISPADWSLEFGAGPEPDGRCFDGDDYVAGCDDEWVTPPYEIPLPTFAEGVAYYGGRLMARYQAGDQDLVTWRVSLPAAEPPPLATGCPTFPIAIRHDAWAVHPSDAPPHLWPRFPWPYEFQYPVPPPTYTTAFPDTFFRNIPATPLADAAAGHVYLIREGVGDGGLAWLRWSGCSSAACLSDSLTYPGNSHTYVNPNDPEDNELNAGDWVRLFTGNVAALSLDVNPHVDRERPLRFILYDEVQGTGSEAQVRIAAFALFRLRGYNLNGADKRILTEFAGWSAGCEVVEPPEPLPPTATPTSTPTVTGTPWPTTTTVATPTAVSTMTATATPDPPSNYRLYLPVTFR
jgi:hypothetical protein